MQAGDVRPLSSDTCGCSVCWVQTTVSPGHCSPLVTRQHLAICADGTGSDPLIRRTSIYSCLIDSSHCRPVSACPFSHYQVFHSGLRSKLFISELRLLVELCRRMRCCCCIYRLPHLFKHRQFAAHQNSRLWNMIINPTDPPMLNNSVFARYEFKSYIHGVTCACSQQALHKKGKKVSVITKDI